MKKTRKNTDPLSILAQGFVLSAFLPYFISELHTNPNQSLVRFYSEFVSTLGQKYSKERNVIFTPGALLGLLYLMLVFPQQKFELKNPTLGFDAIGDEWGKPTIELWNDKYDKVLEHLVRRLRNSLAHGRVQFDQKMNILFEDAPPGKNSKVDFKASMSLECLKVFTGKLAREFKID